MFSRTRNSKRKESLDKQISQKGKPKREKVFGENII